MIFLYISIFIKTLHGKFPFIMLTKCTGCRTSTFLYISLSKTCEIRDGAIFGPRYIKGLWAVLITIAHKKWPEKSLKENDIFP